MERILCSGCSEYVRLDTKTGVLHATRPSNGLRGSKHVPAETVVMPVCCDFEDDTDGTTDVVLFWWDCPLCGYADSFDPFA